MMTPLSFFDTSILIYSDDESSPQKKKRAIRLFSEHHRAGLAVVSLQVLQEYFAAATRKLQVDPEVAQRKVELLARGRVVRFDSEDVIASIELHRLTRLSFWDAMILHAARLAGAEILYSEDFQHNSIVGGVRIVNPFATD